MNFLTIAAPLMLYVTAGSVLVLFVSAIAAIVVILLKLGRLVMRRLGLGDDSQAQLRQPVGHAERKIQAQWTPAGSRR